MKPRIAYWHGLYWCLIPWDVGPYGVQRYSAETFEELARIMRNAERRKMWR